MTHLSNRVSRLLADDNDPLQKSEKQSLIIKLTKLEGDFETKLDAFKSSIQTSTPISTSPVAQLPFVPSVPVRKSIPPCQWNISFTGSTQKESVVSFLEKIEELRISRNVTKEDLFLSACDIFQGPAWNWFLTNRQNFSTWDEVTQKLKSDFLPSFYEQDLINEINNRTMGNNERVTLYISAMECLYLKLTTLPDEKTRVNQIRRNLSPFFIHQLALTEINTIADLTNYCKKLEESRLWSDRYKAPPSKKFGLLEPDLRTFPSGSSSSGYNSLNASNASTLDNTNNLSLKNRISCWNCDKSGHGYSECRSPKKVFCYGCGRKNITKNKCQTCSKNVNTGGGRQPVDVATHTTKETTPPEQKKSKGKTSKKK